jgi:deaminated glutathione amidase
MKLTVATCQFPTSADIKHNLSHVLKQMNSAKIKGAHVVHFPEACLSGYVTHDLDSYRDIDWELLKNSCMVIINEARKLKLWVILGSIHQLTGRHKPHNSLYIISDRGEIVDRYDKMFCAGDQSGKSGELLHFSPGNHFCFFEIRGIRCGAIICHEYRYPELYREYKRMGVELMFHSYHAANIGEKVYQNMQKQVGYEYHKFNQGTTLPEITMPATMQAASASSHVWISCSNSSSKISCWPSFFVRPDGVITGQLKRNIPGILITKVDTKQKLYDSTNAWRHRAMQGIFHSGKTVKDRRSDERHLL